MKTQTQTQTQTIESNMRWHEKNDPIKEAKGICTCEGEYICPKCDAINTAFLASKKTTNESDKADVMAEANSEEALDTI